MNECRPRWSVVLKLSFAKESLEELVKNYDSCPAGVSQWLSVNL